MLARSIIATHHPETLDSFIAKLTETQDMEAPIDPDPRWQALGAWLLVITAALVGWGGVALLVMIGGGS